MPRTPRRRVTVTTDLEKVFMDYLMIELCSIPGVRVWRQNTGSITFLDPHTKQVRVFSSGVPRGAGDLSGIYKPNGQRIEVETKAIKGRYSDEQKRWSLFIQEYGGLYLAARRHKDLVPKESAQRWAKFFAEKVIPAPCTP